MTRDVRGTTTYDPDDYALSDHLPGGDGPDGPTPGRILGVQRLLLGQGQIVEGPDDRTLYDNVWMYATLGEALVAYVRWKDENQHGVGLDEPQGWMRHTGRYSAATRRRSYDERGRCIGEEERA